MNQTSAVESPAVAINEGISPDKYVVTTDKPCTTIGTASVKTSSKSHRFAPVPPPTVALHCHQLQKRMWICALQK